MLVTGAASGIGRATCLRLARDARERSGDAKIAAVDLNPAGLDAVIEELRKPDAEVLPLHGDMDTTDGPTRVVAEAVARFGGLEAFLSLLSSAWARAYSDQQRARRGEQRRHQPPGASERDRADLRRAARALHACPHRRRLRPGGRRRGRREELKPVVTCPPAEAACACSPPWTIVASLTLSSRRSTNSMRPRRMAAAFTCTACPAYTP